MRETSMKRRLAGVGSLARERATHARLEKLDRENERLRSEVSLLRDDLDHERDALTLAMKRLAVGSKRQGRSARPRVLRTVVVAGGAYLLGTRSGRERYDQIMEAVRQAAAKVRRRMRGTEADWQTDLPDAGVPVVPTRGR